MRRRVLDDSSEPLGEDVVHRLLASATLRELGLECGTELGGIPLAALFRLADRMPALHEPHGPAPDAEDLAVHAGSVVTGEPRDERSHVRRAEHVELPL